MFRNENIKKLANCLRLPVRKVFQAYCSRFQVSGVHRKSFPFRVDSTVLCQWGRDAVFHLFFQMISWMLRGQNLKEFVLPNGERDDQLFMGSKVTPRMDAEICLESEAGFNDYRFSLANVAKNRLVRKRELFG